MGDGGRPVPPPPRPVDLGRPRRGGPGPLRAGAGSGPADIDVAQLYENFTGQVLMTIEDFGFCGRGEGGPFVEGGTLESAARRPADQHRGRQPRRGVHPRAQPGERGRPPAARAPPPRRSTPPSTAWWWRVRRRRRRARSDPAAGVVTDSEDGNDVGDATFPADMPLPQVEPLTEPFWASRPVTGRLRDPALHGVRDLPPPPAPDVRGGAESSAHDWVESAGPGPGVHLHHRHPPGARGHGGGGPVQRGGRRARRLRRGAGPRATSSTARPTRCTRGCRSRWVRAVTGGIAIPRFRHAG